MTGLLDGWPALSAFRKTVGAPRTHTTPVRPRGVKILNLGCPVLDGFSRAGLWLNYSGRLIRRFKSKAPPFKTTRRTGHPLGIESTEKGSSRSGR